MSKFTSICRETSPVTYLLLFIGIIGAIYYFFYLMAPSHRGDLVPYVIALAAEGFLIIHTAITFWTMIEGRSNTTPPSWYHNVQARLIGEDNQPMLNEKPVSVSVFVTVYGEDVEIVRKTVEHARDIYGLHRTVILDDGGAEEMQRLADELGVQYINREGSEGAKAGNINNALARIKDDYFAVFDADHVPSPWFLYQTLPFFADENVAFVQTPQYLVNMDSFLSRGSAYAQRIFYGLLCSGKSRFNSMFCVGTNVIFRRSALDDVGGGIYQGSKSEDIWTAMFLHEYGYSSVFLPTVLAYGEAPSAVKAYTKQQERWAKGAFEIFFHRNPLFNSGLSIEQKIQYLASVTFHFTGVAIFLLMILPALFIFLDWAPLYPSGGFINWVVHYSAFYLWQLLLAVFVLNGFKWESILLSVTSFPIYFVAMWKGLFNTEEGWSVTGRQKASTQGIDFIVPHIAFWVFLAITTGLGIYWAGENPSKELYFAIAWNGLNVFLYSVFIGLVFKQEIPQMRQSKYIPS